MLEGSIEENKPEKISVDNREANLLRGDELLKEGEWRKALHVYLEEEDRARLYETMLRFSQGGDDEKTKVAYKYIDLLDKRDKDSQATNQGLNA